MSLSHEIRHGLACNTIQDADTVTEKAVCLAAHPGKIAIFPFLHWYKKRYEGRYKFARLMFTFDMFLLGVIAGLGVVAVLFSLKPTDVFSDNILFSATVAPHDIVSGESSTLVIHYKNNTKESLDHAVLNLTYPDHFLLQDLEGTTDSQDQDTVTLGTIAAGAEGSIKLRGVMFGDVGGEQVFGSHLLFTHGDENIQDEKIASYTFQPVRSTLALELELPERLVAFQPMTGIVHYRNTGSIDFPTIGLEPTWPEGFTFTSADSSFVGDHFALPAIKAGEEGLWKFNGQLGDVAETVLFTFSPSFTFGEDVYHQQTLVQKSPVVPLPLVVSHSVDGDMVRPGSKATITIGYENRGEEPIKNLTLSVDPTSPFVTPGTYEVTAKTVPALAEVKPGEHGTVTVSIPIRSSIQQTETTSENLQLVTRASASFDFGSDGATQRVRTYDKSLSTPLITSLALDSFARYTAPSGDQLGRGPLPPLVGETTKYWVFWNVRGTFHPITNVHIEGSLGPNVTFTGRETVSQNGGVTFDAGSGTIEWSSPRLEPTLSPSAPIVGIAFELAVTPDASQAGSIATLLNNVRITATDATTGAFVSASGSTVTTNLPNDAMAAGFGVVEE